MSLLDDASLVVVPSGYKAGTVYSVKPTNGNGDLSFTRSNDTATRVNSAGLIEKVRTNLVLYSEQFDNAAWTKEALSVTANDIESPDGTQNADLLTANGLSVRKITYSNLSTIGGQSYSLSIYAKKGTNNFVQVAGASTTFGTDVFANFNLDTGVVGSVGSSTTALIESVGDGWYRCTIIGTAIATISSFGLILAIVESSTSIRLEENTLDTSVYLWGAQNELSDFGATDYIPTTTTAVSVGPVANVPRLDYSGGGCPKLLLEPQRTNLVTFSEQFDNAAWGKTATSITANSTTSPDGYTNADTITADGTSSRHDAFLSLSATSGTAYSYSVYVKKNTNDFFQIATGGGFGSNAFANFDLVNGVLGSIGSSATATITNAGGGWYRCTMTATATTTGTTGIYNLISTSSTASRLEVNTLTTSIFIWGAQLEAGSYVSSYIPALSAASTRGSDLAELNPSTLLGATTGSWYIEIDDLTFEVAGTSVPTNYIGDNNTNFLGYEARTSDNKTIYFVKEESNAVTTLYSFAPTTKHKACFVWNGTSLKLFVDGVKQYDDVGFTQPANWDELKFNSSTREAQQTINQTILFPTALTDTQCIELTTL